TICAVVALKICFADLPRSLKTPVTPPASSRVQSKKWVSELSILVKKFSHQQRINSSPAIFSGLCSRQFWQSIQEAAAKKRTGLWKIGWRCFQELAVWRTPKANMCAMQSFLPLSLSAGKRTSHRPSNWNASGKIEISVSQKIYHCLTWRQC